MKRRRIITACASGAALCALALVLLTGCTPTPFVTGAEVAPPAGCEDYRARGGRC